MSRIAASTIAPIPRAIAHPRDDILPETLLVNVLDMASSPYCSYFGTFEGLHELDMNTSAHSTRTVTQGCVSPPVPQSTPVPPDEVPRSTGWTKWPHATAPDVPVSRSGGGVLPPPSTLLPVLQGSSLRRFPFPRTRPYPVM